MYCPHTPVYICTVLILLLYICTGISLSSVQIVSISESRRRAVLGGRRVGSVDVATQRGAELQLHTSAYVSIRQHTSAYVGRRAGSVDVATQLRAEDAAGVGMPLYVCPHIQYCIYVGSVRYICVLIHAEDTANWRELAFAGTNSLASVVLPVASGLIH
jgi:hypothetical protein